MIFKLMK